MSPLFAVDYRTLSRRKKCFKFVIALSVRIINVRLLYKYRPNLNSEETALVEVHTMGMLAR